MNSNKERVLLHQLNHQESIADEVKRVERELMPLANKINDAFNDYWQQNNGKQPQSIELTADQWLKLEYECDSLMGVRKKYVPVGDEVGIFRGVKVYVERIGTLRIGSLKDVENG